ncbi:hypothetical protein FOL47_003277 [Perkinsus chesapeaki]|uniref:Rab-GAP TBC domain-containing protein n=1 Tax=Perkinsus chesapeaki TaxID=330153 RepID=A0A7J6N2Y9_PERCH|nr:hypothetical protein FOL47_003277 [Perkinsus chesapeaki]
MSSSAGAVVAVASVRSPVSPVIEIELPVSARDSTSITPRPSLAPGKGSDAAVLLCGSQVFDIFPESSDLPTDLDCEPESVTLSSGHNYALLRDGQVLTLGDPPRPFKPLKGVVISQLLAGTGFMLAVSRDGSAYTWGVSLLGALGRSSLSESLQPGLVPLSAHAVSAAVGPEHVLVYGDDGSLYGWGNNYNGQVRPGGPEVIAEPTPVDSISALLCKICTPLLACGADHSVGMCACVLDDDCHFKEVILWGGHRLPGVSTCNDVVRRISCPPDSRYIKSLGSRSAVASPSGVYVVFGCSGVDSVIAGEHVKDGYRLSDLMMVSDRLLLLYRESPGLKHRCLSERMQTDSWSFRPANLPAKSWLERRRHRAQVAEIFELGKLNRQKQTSALLERQREAERLTEVWMKDLLPHYMPHRPVPLRMASLWRLNGLPPRARAALWPAAIGNPLRVTRSLYDVLIRKAKVEEAKWLKEISTMATTADGSPAGRAESGSFISHLRAIDLDLPRTLPDLAVMSMPDGPLRKECRLVLSAFAMYRPDIGYVQGMSFLAAMLLLYMDSFSAFVCLSSLLLSSPTLLGLYQLDIETNTRRFRIFMRLLRAHNPALHRHLTDVGVCPEQFLPMWFLTLYSRPLTTESAALIWDLYLLDKEPVLYVAGIAILDILSDRLRTRDFDECLMLLLRDTREIIGNDRETLLDAMNSVVVPDTTYLEITDLEAEFVPPLALPSERLFACTSPP